MTKNLSKCVPESTGLVVRTIYVIQSATLLALLYNLLLRYSAKTLITFTQIPNQINHNMLIADSICKIITGTIKYNLNLKIVRIK